MLEKVCKMRIFTETEQIKLKNMIKKYFRTAPIESKDIKQFVSKAHSVK